MNKKFKTVLLWLLLFAFPLQGLATSGMLFCKMPDHHESTMMRLNSWDKHDHKTHQHDQHESSATVSSHSHDHSHHGDTLQHDMTKCSACAACCVGAAIISSLGNGFSLAPPESHPIPFSIVRFAGYIPAGLERPPRSILI